MRPNRMLTRFTSSELRNCKKPIKAKYKYTAVKRNLKIVGTSYKVSKELDVTISRLIYICNSKINKYNGWSISRIEI